MACRERHGGRTPSARLSAVVAMVVGGSAVGGMNSVFSMLVSVSR
jgi:hypothetical protein